MGNDWKKNNKDKVREQKKRYKERHKDKIKEEKKRYYKRNKLKIKLSLYGLTIEDYNLLLKSQNNTCAICKLVEPASLCIDHDHVTGQVRGLLCNHCNVGIGMFKDNPAILNEAIRYLNNPH